MTYKWRLKEYHGQPSTGFHEVYESTGEWEESYLALINYLPNIDSVTNERIVHATLFIANSGHKITDGKFHWIHDDIGNLIKENKSTYFGEEISSPSTFFTEIYFVDELPNINYYTHGDFGIQ
jgi:hypothetical protein